ncbi:MAG TPA: SPOR domain-containing protein, partial [Pyrinomonadaceae bacterium]
TSAPGNTQPGAERGFAILIASFNTPEEAAPLVKELEAAGYTEVRIAPAAPGARAKLSVLVGRFKRDDAAEVAKRLRATGNPRLANVRVVEERR